MVKAKSHSAFLRRENAVIIWNADLSLLPALAAMVHTCLAGGPAPGAATAVATVPAKAVGTSTADTKKDTAHGVSRGWAKHEHKRRVLVAAASLLVAACACFITLGVTVGPASPHVSSLNCPKNTCPASWVFTARSKLPYLLEAGWQQLHAGCVAAFLSLACSMSMYVHLQPSHFTGSSECARQLRYCKHALESSLQRTLVCVQVAQSGTSAGGCSKPVNITGVLWSDEFEDKCGTVTGIDPQNWNFQIGNGSAYGLNGMQLDFTVPVPRLCTFCLVPTITADVQASCLVLVTACLHVISAYTNCITA